MSYIDNSGDEYPLIDENKDFIKLHHIPELKERKKRNSKIQDLNLCLNFYRGKYAAAEFFKGSFFDYWRFWNREMYGIRSHCAACEHLFQPVSTPEKIYQQYLSNLNQTHYRSYS